MKNEFQTHKKNDRIKWIFTGTAFLLIAIMLTGVCLQIFGTGKQKPSEWFDKPDTEQTTSDENGKSPVIDDNGNEMVSGKVYPMSSKMVFSAPSSASTVASNGITLKATITPDSATNKEVDWEVEFVNSSSEWATDKVATDYVTVTPTADGALTATVVCQNAFAEQIRIKVISRDNPDATANCIVDFSKKIENFNLKFGNLNINLGGTTNVKIEVNPNGVGMGGKTSANITTTNVYTLEDSFTYTVKTELLWSDGIIKMLRLNDCGIGGIYDNSEKTQDLTTSGYYFDFAHEVKNWTYDKRQGMVVFGNLSTSTLINSYFCKITQPEMFNIVVTATGKYSKNTYTSLIVCTGYTNQASVNGIILDGSTIVL